MTTVEDGSNLANEKRDAENGQLVGDKGGAVGRGKDVEERIRCNDSVA